MYLCRRMHQLWITKMDFYNFKFFLWICNTYTHKKRAVMFNRVVLVWCSLPHFPYPVWSTWKRTGTTKGVRWGAASPHLETQWRPTPDLEQNRVNISELVRESCCLMLLSVIFQLNHVSLQINEAGHWSTIHLIYWLRSISYELNLPRTKRDFYIIMCHSDSTKRLSVSFVFHERESNT